MTDSENEPIEEEEKEESFGKTEEKSFFKKRKIKNHVVSRETAEEQLTGWLDFYNLDPERLTDSETDTADAVCKRLIAFTMQGKITFNDDGTCVHKIKDSGEVIYRALKGQAKTQGKKGKKNESDETGQLRRIYSMMGSLGNIPVKRILLFEAVDMSIVESVGFLLLIV